MRPEPDPLARTLAEPAWAECEAVIKRFEDAWRGPTRPDLAAFAPAEHPLRSRLLAELAHIDIELRFRHGEEVRVEDYFARFPELAGAALAVELISAEFALRHRAGPVSRDDYLARFPQYHEALTDLLPSEPAATLTGSSVRTWSPLRPVVPPSIPGYVIEGEVGRGGMGVVYRARQPGLSRVVAVKTLRGPDAGTRDRFRREAEAMARLDHANIVPVFEVGEWQTPTGRAVPYYTMKWYSGGGLDSRPSGPGTDPAAHARLVEAVARAVHHAHQRGVLHRDLKPSNVLLDEAGEPHVADFGLAGLFDPLSTPHGGATGTAVATQVGVRRAMLGTPAYMAPEQARNPSRVTTAADVYGLGAILYHLLTGRPPFIADDPLTTLELAATTPAEPPTAANPAVSRDLEAVCLKCLAKDPAGRYASAEALADDLARWRAGSQVAARPLPAWSRAWRWVRRNGLLAGMALATFAALVVAVVVLAVGQADVREREAGAVEAANREYRVRCDLEAALAREQRSLYLERVRTAGLLHAANQPRSARRLLDECPPQLRGWEWLYLHSLGTTAIAPRRVALPAQTASLAVAPDGTRVALGPEGVGTVAVRDAATGGELRRVPGGSVAFHPDSRRLAVWAGRGMIRLLAEDGTGQGSIDVGGEAVHALAFNPSGTRLAVAGPDSVTLWDVASGSRVGRAKPTGGAFGVAFHPGGEHVATADADGVVRLRSATTGEPVRDFVADPVASARVAFSPDGLRLVSGGTDGTVRVWDVESGRELLALATTGGPVRGVGWAGEVVFALTDALLTWRPAGR